MYALIICTSTLLSMNEPPHLDTLLKAKITLMQNEYPQISHEYDREKNVKIKTPGLKKVFTEWANNPGDNCSGPALGCCIICACTGLVSGAGALLAPTQFLTTLSPTSCTASICCSVHISRPVICQYSNNMIIKYRNTSQLNKFNHFYTQLINAISSQDVIKVIELLNQVDIPPLDVILNETSQTPLTHAILSHDSKKDPQALILKDLIAQGASLWYKNRENQKNNEASNSHLEEDFQRRKIKPHNQPILMILNKKHLHNRILKPLCKLASNKDDK